jgi:hypothetical protein
MNFSHKQDSVLAHWGIVGTHVDQHSDTTLQATKPYGLPPFSTKRQSDMTIALNLVASYLCTQYPSLFSTSHESIHNHITTESLPLTPYRFLPHWAYTVKDWIKGTFGYTSSIKPVPDHHPLAIAARLAKEDLNILVKRPEESEFRLVASVLCFPAGLDLRKGLGSELTELHRPVPSWKEKLSFSVEKSFNRLSTTNGEEAEAKAQNVLFYATTQSKSKVWETYYAS